MPGIEVASASIRMEPNFDGFSGAVGRGVQQEVGQVRQSAQQLGGTLTAAVTLPVAAIGATAVKSFKDFDQALVESQAIMGDLTENEMAAMEEAARDVGVTSTFSATQAAESFFFLASAGLDAEQSIGALPAVARFAQAGMFDMATATDLATDAQSALGLTVPDTQQNLENLTRVTDVLVGANTLANASVEQFATSLTTKAGTALKILNKDLEEGVAVLAFYADRGIKGQLAGELLSRTLKFLNIRAEENSDAFEELGIRVFDAEGKMRNVADISEDLTTALKDLSDQERTAALAALGFTGRTQDAILTLIGGADQIRDYEAALRDVGGITEQVANKQLQSFEAQLSLAKSRITDVAISLGKELAPALLTITEFAASAVEFFGALPAPVKRFVGELAGIAALAGPLLLIGGKLAQALLAIRTLRGGTTRGVLAAQQYAAAQGQAAAATAAMGRAAAAAAGPVTALSTAQFGGRIRTLPGVVGGGGNPLGLGTAGQAAGGVFAGKFAAASKAGLAGLGGLLVGDLVGGLVQGIETQEGTIQDQAKDTVGNALRFGITGAAIGSTIAPGIGTAIGGAVGAIGGGILGFFKSGGGDEEIETAAEQVRSRIADVITNLELSEREQQAAAAVLDVAIQNVINSGVESGLNSIEAAGLGDQAEEVLVRLLELGIDPTTAGQAVRDKVFDALQAGLSPGEIASSLASEIQRGELFTEPGADAADQFAEGFEEELTASFQETFAAAAAEGADFIEAFNIALQSGDRVDLGFLADQLILGLRPVPSIFEEQFEAAKNVSTDKMLELVQANTDAFAAFEGNLRTLTNAGLVALADELGQAGAVAEAEALANDIETALQIEAELRGISREDVQAFLDEFEGADVATIADNFVARFVDPLRAAELKAEAEAKAAELLEADEAYRESAYELASSYGESMNTTMDEQTTEGFDDFGVRGNRAVADQLSLTAARGIAEAYVGEIRRVLSAAVFSVPAPTISGTPAPPLTGPNLGPAGPFGNITKNVEMNFINPTVQSADRDVQKALVLDRVEGYI